MSDSATTSVERARTWPLTREAWDHLVNEIAQVRKDLADLNGQGLEEGILRLPVAIAERRLGTLNEVLDRCELVEEAQYVAIGCRATLRDGNGEAMSYEVVFPGDGDADTGCISAESPIGAAILGARSGDVVDVIASAGDRTVTVISVE